MSLSKKVLIGAGVLIALVVAYWLISPLFINEEVSESLEEIMAVSNQAVPGETPLMQEEAAPGFEEVAAGTFTGLAGHSGEGSAKLIKTGNVYYVRFEEDFRVTNGPDLFVYFGKDGRYVKETVLGKLKGNVGSQNYEVPADLNPAEYNEVWVWCRAFSVPFATARLE